MRAALAFFSVVVVSLFGLLMADALFGGTRATAAPDPYDFEVTVAAGIPTPGPGLPTCSAPDADGVRTCAISGEISTGASLANLTGVVRQTSTGRSGRLSAICRWSGDFRATARVGSSLSVELTALSGSVKQWCSWFVSLPGAGNITGSMSGGGSLALAGPTSGAYTGTLDVSVGGGAGEFAGLIGSGSFTHRQEFPVPLGYALRSLTAAHSEPSRLQLSLRKGKPRALVAAPAARLSAQTDTGLRVVSVPGSSCGATARKGTRSVRLAPALDRNRDGLVVVVPKLRPKLATGRWTIAVKCTYRVGGTAGTALAQVAVTVS